MDFQTFVPESKTSKVSKLHILRWRSRWVFQLLFLSPKLVKSHIFWNGGGEGVGYVKTYLPIMCLNANFKYIQICLFQTPTGASYTMCKWELNYLTSLISNTCTVYHCVWLFWGNIQNEHQIFAHTDSI